MRPPALFGWARREAPADRPPPPEAASEAPPVDFSAEADGSLAYRLRDAEDERKPRTLISFLGEASAGQREMIDAVASACSAQGEFPVVVLSDLQSELLASSHAPLEFIPERRHVKCLGGEDYARYAARRWALVQTKWDIRHEIFLGQSFDEFMAAQLGGEGNAPAAGAP